jgi:hypothetical protein
MRIALMVSLLAACAVHDVRAHFPALPDQPTGTLVLLLSQPASEVSVAVNGVLVVEDAHTGRVVIDGVPVGTEEVIMAANGSDKQFHVWVGGDHATTVPLGVPDPGSGFVKTLAGTLITILVYSWLHH